MRKTPSQLYFKHIAKLPEHIFRAPLSHSFLSSWNVPVHSLHRNINIIYQTCSKLTTTIPERCHWCSGIVHIPNTFFWNFNYWLWSSNCRMEKLIRPKCIYIMSFCFPLEIVLNCIKNLQSFLFPHIWVFFVHQRIFEKTARAVALGSLDFLAGSFAKLKIFLDMNLDHHLYYERSY